MAILEKIAHMSSAVIAKLGMVFLGLGFCATFLMYWLWGFPFDKATRTSAAPRPLMYMHRVLGYLFVICYVAIMWHMVPRLWTYQVEFPARTVAHIILGLTTGFLLLIKISIMRFFRHFEEWMPYLGTAIMLCTVLLLGLSVPFIFRENVLAASAPGGSVYSTASLKRVAMLLPTAGLPRNAPGPEVLSTEHALRKGREVLLDNCVKCHDLRTILIRPRTPSNWYRTVARMAEKPALFDPITEEQQWFVTAYLIAITPDLQESVKKLREEKEMMEKLREVSAEMTLASAGEGSEEGAGETAESEGGGGGDDAKTGQGGEDGEGGDDAKTGQGEAAQGAEADKGQAMATVDAAKAKAVYEEQCSQCHELEDVDADPPRSARAVDRLIARMIENGMEDVEPADLKLIKWYLIERFVKKSAK